jgi:SAM-dependent methyltransferase
MEESGYIKSDQDFPKDACRCCGYSETHIFYELKSVPANSCILIPTREEALVYPKGDIILGFCLRCGFISNLAFDPDLAEYSDRYEGTQSFSPTFNAFQKELALQLVERYGLRNKNILEIGCGQGEFLALLCEMGGNRGVGYDPGYRGGHEFRDARSAVTVVKDYYSERHADRKVDFVCCKMTLEHIPKPLEFTAMLRRSLSGNPGATLFFQVPDAERTMRVCAFEDIYYEHSSYFTTGSLARLFSGSGFGVTRVGTEYGGQYLTIEAKVSCPSGATTVSQSDKDIRSVEKHVNAFRNGVWEKIAGWQATIAVYAREGKKVALWGSGSKASAFTTALGLSQELPYVVDINPRKNGFYMAGTGQRIVMPEFLQDYGPDAVVVMNGVYRDEIRKELERIGVEVDLLVVQ